MANEYLTYVQLPSEGGQIGTSPDGEPLPQVPWHPIQDSRIRTQAAHPTGQLRSREIARAIYPLYPLRTDLLAQPTILPSPIPAACAGNLLFASCEGLFEDNGTDQTDLLQAACLKAIDLEWPLILDLHRIRSSKPLRLENLPPFSTLRIYSFIGTQIIISAGTNGNPWGIISGQEIAGLTPIPFNSGNGFTPELSHPYTQLAQPDGPSWTIRPTTATAIQPGYLLKIQSKRLPVSEHRFCMYEGELNRARAVNSGVVELDEKLRHHYRTGTLHSTTIAASQNIPSSPSSGIISLTLTVAPPADLTSTMHGLLMTTEGGVERHNQWWDPESKTLSFPYGGTHDQLAYSSLPSVGSPITLTAVPYVFLFSPINITLSGFTIDATEDLGSTTRGLTLAHADRPIIENIGTINCQSWGLNISNCFEPSVRFSRSDRSNDDNLGYTILFTECRNASLDGYYGHNNRRMTDTGGQCQCIGTHITNFQVTGGWKQNLGLVWEDEVMDPEEFNYGLGDHGQALDWVWESGIVRNVKIGAIFRGGTETIRNVKFEGFFSRIFSFGAGYGRTIENIQVDDGLSPESFLDPDGGLHWEGSSTPALIDCPIFQFAQSGYSYQGPCTIRGITINGAISYLIFFNNAHELGNVVSDWVIEGVAWRTPIGGSNCHLFKANDIDNPDQEVVSLQNFTLQNINVYYRGRPESILSETAGGVFLRNNSWMRTGHGKYRFRLSDDGRLEFPFAIAKSADPGNLYRLVTYPSAPPSSDWYADILVEAHFGTIVREITPITNVTIQDLADIGVSDPSGSLNFARDPSSATNIVLKNRLGEEIWGVLELTQ